MVWPCPCPWARRLGNPFPTAVRATREQGWEGLMRRWIAGVLIAVLTMSTTAPVAWAQSTPLIGGGLTALPTQTTGPNLVQNPGFETAGPAGWPASGGWSLDQLQMHSGSFSYRRDSGGTMSQTFLLKTGVYKASAWVKTQGLG